MNCLIGALLYKFRYGGILRYMWPTSEAFWGHWWIWKDPYSIWYSSRKMKIHQHLHLNPIQQIWFEGKYRYRKEY